MELTVHGVIMENVSLKRKNSLLFSDCDLFKGDLHFGDVKLAELPAWVARRDKTPMGVYQGSIRSK